MIVNSRGNKVRANRKTRLFVNVVSRWTKVKEDTFDYCACRSVDVDTRQETWRQSQKSRDCCRVYCFIAVRTRWWGNVDPFTSGWSVGLGSTDRVGSDDGRVTRERLNWIRVGYNHSCRHSIEKKRNLATTVSLSLSLLDLVASLIIDQEAGPRWLFSMTNRAVKLVPLSTRCGAKQWRRLEKQAVQFLWTKKRLNGPTWSAPLWPLSSLSSLPSLLLLHCQKRSPKTSHSLTTWTLILWKERARFRDRKPK